MSVPLSVVKYHYISAPTDVSSKIVDVVWTRLDDFDAWSFIVQCGLWSEHKVDARQLVTVDVPSKSWPEINHE